MTAPLVRTDELAHTYGSGLTAVVAVHGVSCVIGTDTRAVVTGRAGAGKTTLLHLLAGMKKPTAGTIDWPAFEPSPPGPDLIGLVLQDGGLLRDLDVRLNVALPLVLAGRTGTAVRDAVDGALDLVGLTGFAKKAPRDLSGEQIRLAILARALAPAPKLILADDPAGWLDRREGERLFGRLVHAADRLAAGLLVATAEQAPPDLFGEHWSMVDGKLVRDR
ncbi:ATP-binding cassette domain-containing protein [Amycolatopsis sp. BJA-103]|uniref:ATP-binding cassette domain-containing protein n=1 Tax=unclassified Amycolatopsis TaxID=2618356 RepID=UPI000C764FB0|nr:ATP-binding cassette domain-containing protein [Amycolatopsis sp. BJA-103]AUI56940.1 ABC transporter ATP-binding protein [Amycolatopsis sp. BJA-103]PNE13335.1 ABC transporter ATP-binding protein [Amycolatopsis sp. BJA-103]